VQKNIHKKWINSIDCIIAQQNIFFNLKSLWRGQRSMGGSREGSPAGSRTAIASAAVDPPASAGARRLFEPVASPDQGPHRSEARDRTRNPQGSSGAACSSDPLDSLSAWIPSLGCRVAGNNNNKISNGKRPVKRQKENPA